MRWLRGLHHEKSSTTIPRKDEDIRAAVAYGAELARENVWKITA